MSEDETPDLIAALDQLGRALLDLAKPMRAYFLALVEEGFTEAEALQLTIACQHDVLRSGSG